MGERGSALIETLLVTAVIGVVWAAAAGVLSDLPAQAVVWEDAAARRQTARAIESRFGRVLREARVLRFEMDDQPIEIPAIFPRRLGFWRPDEAGVVRTDAVTVIARQAVQRLLTLGEPLPPEGGRVLALPDAGCGALPACGVARGDTLLAVARSGAIGLFRVIDTGALLELNPLMPPGLPVFDAGSLLVPIIITVFEFDAVEGTLRAYDGYRSDNAVADGVETVAIGYTGAAAMGDGPFIGEGPLAYDVDQRGAGAIEIRLRLDVERVLRWSAR